MLAPPHVTIRLFTSCLSTPAHSEVMHRWDFVWILGIFCTFDDDVPKFVIACTCSKFVAHFEEFAFVALSNSEVWACSFV